MPTSYTEVETIGGPGSEDVSNAHADPPKKSWLTSLRRRKNNKKVTVDDVDTPQKPDSHKPHIEVTSPVEGDAVIAGHTLSIKWKSNFRGGFVRIELVQVGLNEAGDIVKEMVISDSTFNDGSFPWTTKTNLTQKSYKVLVSNHDCEGYSSPFSLADNKKELKLLSPQKKDASRKSKKTQQDDEYDDEYYSDEDEIDSNIIFKGFVEQRSNILPNLYDPERKSRWQNKYLWTSKWLEISSHYLFFYRDNTKQLHNHLLPSSIAILKANRDNSAGTQNKVTRALAVRRINKLKKREENNRLPLAALDLCCLQARRHDELDQNGMFFIDLAPEPGEVQGECIKFRAHSPGDAQDWLDEIEKVQEAYGVSDVVNKELLYACRSQIDDPKRVAEALDRLANANYKDNDGTGMSPLMEASRNANIHQVRMLLQRDAGPNLKNHLGDTALVLCASEGTLKVKKSMKERVNSTGQIHTRKFMTVKIAKVLLDNSANPNLRNNCGNAALHEAATHNYIAMAKLLLLMKAKMNVTNNKGYSPLRAATQLRHIKMVELLLDNGADTKIPDHAGTTPLIECCQDNNYKCVDLLMTAGADPNVGNQAMRTALMQSALHNTPKCAKLLLGYDQTNLDLQDAGGYSALMEASKRNHLRIVKYLIKGGADVNLKSAPKRVALSYAREENNLRVSHQLESTLVGCRIEMEDAVRMPYWGPTHRPTRGQAEVLCMHKGWAPQLGWRTRHTIKFDNGYRKKTVLYDEGGGGPWRDLTYDDVKGIVRPVTPVPSSSSGYGSESYSDEDSSDSDEESENSSESGSSNGSSSGSSNSSGSSSSSSTRKRKKRRRRPRKERPPFTGYGNGLLRSKPYISPYCKKRVQKGGLFNVHVYAGSQTEKVHFVLHKAYVKLQDIFVEPGLEAKYRMAEAAKAQRDKYKKVSNEKDGDGDYDDTSDDDDSDKGDDDDDDKNDGGEEEEDTKDDEDDDKDKDDDDDDNGDEEDYEDDKEDAQDKKNK